MQLMHLLVANKPTDNLQVLVQHQQDQLNHMLKDLMVKVNIKASIRMHLEGTLHKRDMALIIKDMLHLIHPNPKAILRTLIMVHQLQQLQITIHHLLIQDLTIHLLRLNNLMHHLLVAQFQLVLHILCVAHLNHHTLEIPHILQVKLAQIILMLV